MPDGYEENERKIGTNVTAVFFFLYYCERRIEYATSEHIYTHPEHIVHTLNACFSQNFATN